MEALKGRVRAFAYWMSGSLRCAEDLAEEAFFRAGRLPDLPAEAAARSAWLEGYAARRCLEDLDGLPPRGLPAWLPRREGAGPAGAAGAAGPFLEPFPDGLYPELPGPGEGSAARFGARESVSFAFLSALQLLPVQARAALVLHDVMGEGTGGMEESLSLSGSNLEDLLECARDALADSYDTAAGRREPPAEDRAAGLFMRYLFPWESGDPDRLMEVLSDDVVLQLVPSGEWHRGREAVRAYLAAGPLAGGVEEARGRWRLLPLRANGQLGFGVYELVRESRMFKADAIEILSFEGEVVVEIVRFADPGLFGSFELLPEVFAQG